ncbi:hypothetical protein JYT28_00320 [Desulfobulbus sp. AH-315-M07]|nr:hypothetical protein [Desulfobulbus sp. AH-315-M07]
MWVTLLLDNPNEGAPTTSGAWTWKDAFGLDGAYILADPNFSMVPGSSVGTPQTTLIDPRTMKVQYVKEGYDGNFSPLENLAQQNM